MLTRAVWCWDEYSTRYLQESSVGRRIPFKLQASYSPDSFPLYFSNVATRLFSANPRRDQKKRKGKETCVDGWQKGWSLHSFPARVHKNKLGTKALAGPLFLFILVMRRQQGEGNWLPCAGRARRACSGLNGKLLELRDEQHIFPGIPCPTAAATRAGQAQGLGSARSAWV